MMHFSAGYQYPDDPEGERFPEIVEDYLPQVSEVYFAPGNERSARTPAAEASGFTEEEASVILREDLAVLKKSGVALNLLFNANCHGAGSVAKSTADRVLRTVDSFGSATGIDSVTTASFFIAHVIREHFPGLRIRASVNMKLGTVEALEYASEVFDSFCIQRDINYHFAALERIAGWARRNGKHLCLLANSGCLRNCAAQIFHDNLVAHIGEMKTGDCLMTYDPVFCRRFYSGERHRWEYLMHSTVIRPEDVPQYESIVPLMKLATRTHWNPRLVLDAYTRGRFTGNIFDLTEPGHGVFFRGFVLENGLIPPEYWQKKSSCDENCRACGFCEQVMKCALVPCPELQ